MSGLLSVKSMLLSHKIPHYTFSCCGKLLFCGQTCTVHTAQLHLVCNVSHFLFCNFCCQNCIHSNHELKVASSEDLSIFWLSNVLLYLKLYMLFFKLKYDDDPNSAFHNYLLESEAFLSSDKFCSFLKASFPLHFLI